MRQTAGALNRTWLIVLGVLGLLIAAVGGLVAAGQFAALGARLGLSLPAVRGSDRVVGGAHLKTLFDSLPVVIGIGVAGLVVGLLGLLWALAQIPRRNTAPAFRLSDDSHTGVTRCDPSVLSAAVEDQVKALPGVTHAAAVVRGSVDRPELTVKVTADDDTDIANLLDTIHTTVAGDLAAALETQLDRLAVQLELSRARTSATSVTL